MNRLQKKCFIASAAFHGGLLVILLFGSAMMSRKEESDSKIITLFNPDKVSDAPSSGGGGPESPTISAVTPPINKPAPPDVKPVTKPVEPVLPQIKPEPPKPVVQQKPKPVADPKPKPVKPKAEDLTANPKPTKKPIVDNTDLVPTKRGVQKPVPQNTESSADAAARDARRAAARQIASSMRNLNKNLSSSDLVLPASNGGGSSQISANYGDIIYSKYYNAWSIPLDADEHAGAILAKITIARNGNVISAKIIKRSGNSVLDRSVQNVLDTVTFIEPFPEGSSDKERTVTVQFEPQAKRQTG